MLCLAHCAPRMPFHAFASLRWWRLRLVDHVIDFIIQRINTHLPIKTVGARSLSFSQVFPLSDQILIFLGHCLPDLRHRHWVFSAKGSWPQPNTSRHSIRNSLPMSTHIYCFSHKTFMCLIWNLCYCFYQSSGEVVGDGGWRCVSTRSKTKFRA